MFKSPAEGDNALDEEQKSEGRKEGNEKEKDKEDVAEMRKDERREK